MVVAVLAVAAAALWATWPETVLEIRAGEGGSLVKVIPVSTGERITYSYLHSVQKSRVDEVLQVDPNGHLVVKETEYDMFGAGLPSDLPDGDLSLDANSGRFRITNMSRDIPVLRIRVAFTAEQTLDVKGDRFRLDSLAAPTSLLVIEVGSRHRISAIAS
jgi:hypothetical protein